MNNPSNSSYIIAIYVTIVLSLTIISNDVNAKCEDDTYCIAYTYEQTTHTNNFGQSINQPTSIELDSNCNNYATSALSTVPEGGSYYSTKIWQWMAFKDNPGTWYHNGIVSLTTVNPGVPGNSYATGSTKPDWECGEGPPDYCADEINNAIQQCGEGYYEIDMEDCSYECLPSDECTEEYNALVATCGDVGIKNWNNETCWGECDNPCDKEDPCPEIVQGYIEQCGGEDLVEAITCDAEFDTDGCLIGVLANNLCKDGPENCDQYKQFVTETCGGSQFIASYYCNDFDFDNKFHTCYVPQVDEDEPPDPGGDKPTEDPETPDTDDPQEEPDPNSTDSETLKDIEENTRSTVKNTQEIAEQLAETNQTLGWIGDNTKIIADNTAKIEDSIDSLSGTIESGNDKIVDGLEGVVDSISDLEDAIEGNTESTASLVTDGPGDYVVEDHDFGSRTSQFLEEMKTTGLFSVPTEFFSSIPSGGSPVFEIDGGETFGEHTLDFSVFDTGLLALRAVIQIAFMWLAIRIVALKR